MIFNVPYRDRGKFLAFLLWKCLGSKDNLPFLSEVEKDDLALFKEETCLIDLRKEGLKTLYVGDKLLQYAGFESLHYDTELSMDDISDEAVDMQTMIDGLFITYEMAEPHHKRPWLCLPFTERGQDGCAFILCVHGDDDRDNDGLEPRDWLDAARIRFRHMEGGRAETHEQLYDILAAVYAAGQGAATHAKSYQALLKEAGLRAQARAPFTPLLKMVFGQDHDKTRLAEYSAALAWLQRNAIPPREAAATFKSFPGGIKGCVSEERRLRRSKHKNRQTLHKFFQQAGGAAGDEGNVRFALLQQTGKDGKPHVRYEIGPENPKFTNICEAFEKALEHERPD